MEIEPGAGHIHSTIRNVQSSALRSRTIPGPSWTMNPPSVILGLYLGSGWFLMCHMSSGWFLMCQKELWVRLDVPQELWVVSEVPEELWMVPDVPEELCVVSEVP